MLTVVISSYQYGHLAAHCIESILSQTVQPEKILFVDDGVGDCTHLPTIYPEVEYTLRDQNLGTVESFQDMLMKVDTEYTMFIGADNWLRSDAVELLTSGTTHDILTYDIAITGELKDKHPAANWPGSEPVNGDIWWKRDGRHHGSVMYRTSLGKSVGYRRHRHARGNANCEDQAIWEDMLKAGATVHHIAEPLLHYRRHRENCISDSRT